MGFLLLNKMTVLAGGLSTLAALSVTCWSAQLKAENRHRRQSYECPLDIQQAPFQIRLVLSRSESKNIRQVDFIFPLTPVRFETSPDQADAYISARLHLPKMGISLSHFLAKLKSYDQTIEDRRAARWMFFAPFPTFARELGFHRRVAVFTYGIRKFGNGVRFRNGRFEITDKKSLASSYYLGATSRVLSDARTDRDLSRCLQDLLAPNRSQ